MASTETEKVFVLPGDTIDRSLIPESTNKRPLRLGPGLRHVPPDTLQPTIAGELVTNPKKKSMFIDYNSRRVYLLPAFHTHIPTNFPLTISPKSTSPPPQTS